VGSGLEWAGSGLGAAEIELGTDWERAEIELETGLEGAGSGLK